MLTHAYRTDTLTSCAESAMEVEMGKQGCARHPEGAENCPACSFAQRSDEERTAKKTPRLLVLFPEPLRSALRAAAREDNVAEADIVRMALSRYLAARGVLTQ